ncbi:hypothetical protein [Parasphingopyxis algicola]|uniref:hypothetical protein n=1 Tax=Parasphingopyxis algicola TaxID=2026624 RepID=UPI001C409E3B|nr:hypothetical protein [Parasphingopyxis algicola]
MASIRIMKISLLFGAAAALSGCAIYDGYGTGYYGDRYAGGAYPDECYDKQGYLYADCEDAGYIARNGFGYGSIFYHNRYGPYGWYDGFYYPGYSYYIYDRRGHRHRWGDRHRSHWEGRRHARGGHDGRQGYRRNRDGANRDQRRRGREGRRDRGQAGYRGPYPPVVNNRRNDAGSGGGRRGPPSARPTAPRNAAPARQPNTRSTNNSTRQLQRMRNGPRETHPE